MLKKILLVYLFFTVTIYAQNITIAVAANVSYAIDELKTEFSKLYPDIKVRVILGGSGKLTTQIKNNAPYQLFMSANMRYPEALYKQKIATTKPRIYAQGGLAILSKKRFDLSKGLDFLKNKKIKKIAIANPKTAPYGKATVEALKNIKIYNNIKYKFIYSESISQTISYTIVAADVGIIANSSLYSSKMRHFKKGVNWIPIDKKLYTPIDQGIVILKQGKNSKEVLAFYNFIFSKKAKKIFKKFGYNIL
jgi:molybdate transport system substrate-binding protein